MPLIYLCFFSSEDESSYLDTIDAIFAHEDTIFAVGRNNDNDKELTKAKFAIYNKKQEKIYEKIYNKGYTSRFYDLLVDKEGVVSKIQVKATGCKTKNNIYQVSLKSCGGTKGKEYKTIINTDVDYIFIVNTELSMYLIQIIEIHNKSTINLGKK